MGDAREQVVRLLREAHSTELRRLAELRAATGGADGEYRERLEAHLDEERRHADRVQRRLDQLGGTPGLVEAGLGVVSGLVAVGLRIARRPLDLVEDLTTASTSFEGPREQAAAEAFELSGYIALERVAADSGDDETAELARAIQEDERRMLEAIEEALRALADEVAGGPPAAAEEAPAPAAAEPEQAAARAVEREPEPPAATDATSSDAIVADEAPPEADLIGVEDDPSPAVMREAARDAAEDDSELVAEFSEPGAEAGAGAEINIDPPWDGYDRMTAAEIQRRLADAELAEAATVQLYERAGKGRTSVLRAAERALREQSARSGRT